MYLFSLLVTLQVLSVSVSHDIELQGIIKLSSDFHKLLGIENEQQEAKHSIYVRHRARHDKKLLRRSSIMRAASVTTNRTQEILEYVNHIKMKGNKTLKDVGNRIMKKLGLGKDFEAYIKNLIEGHMTLIQNYTEFVAAEKTEHVIDEELIFLDMVETACRLIYEDQKKLLDKAFIIYSNDKKLTTTPSINNTVIILTQTLSEFIFRHSINTKKEEMKYICNKYDICRPYPAATDYFADFIVEVLKLPDEKLNLFVNLIKQLLVDNEAFFETITEKEDTEIIKSIMKEHITSYYKIRKILPQLRLILTERFKIIHSSNLKLKIKTQAFRIPLDIINKAIDYDYIVLKTLAKTVIAMRSWVREDKAFPESIIKQMFNGMIKVLENNLSKHAKNEMSVLIATTLKGTSNNEKLQQSLFNNGSKFVKGGNHHFKLKII